MKLKPHSMVAHRALEQVPGNGGISEPRDFVVAIRAGVNIAELAGGTDREQLGRNVATVHTLGPSCVCANFQCHPVGISVLLQDSMDLGQAIGGELEIGIAARVSMCAVDRAVGVDLDRRMRPKITTHSSGPPEVVGGGVWLVANNYSNALHSDRSFCVVCSFHRLYVPRSISPITTPG